MYRGNNPIAKRSQEWFADAFLKLLETKPYSQITIKELCTKADLSRQTFYQMFDGKEDVARYAIHCHVRLPFLCEQTDLTTSAWLTQLTVQFARAVRDNKEMILLYRKNNLQYLLYDDISKIVSKIEKKIFRSELVQYEPLTSAFFTGALARSLLFLVEHEEISDEEFANFFCSALKGKYYNFE